MRVKAILFDFWQTLFVDTKERATFDLRRNLVYERLQAHGNPPLERITGAFEESRAWFIKIYHFEQRTPDVRERLGWILDHLSIAIPPVEMKSLVFDFEEIGINLNPLPSPHIQEILPQLGRDFSLGIVSDTGYTPGRVLRKHLETHGMLRHFSAFSFSNETGHAKPHPETFMTALNVLGVEPRSAMHCGDLPDHDILGANELGITSVLYTGCNEARTDGIVSDYTISDWHELLSIVGKGFS